MRIYKDFIEAKGEIRRDLKEMGVRIENERMQDKRGSFPTVELTNYGYTVLNPIFADLTPTQEWAEYEWEERKKGIQGRPANPGGAWITRSDHHMVWQDFLEIDGHPLREDESPVLSQLDPDSDARFAYTYSQRFAQNDQVLAVIRELKRNPMSRQLYVSVWDPTVDSGRLGVRRVPCSLGYHFIYREGRLHITYTMRSCDFVTHWENDVWLACRLLAHVAIQANLRPGTFCQFVNSLHVYEKDVSEVF